MLKGLLIKELAQRVQRISDVARVRHFTFIFNFGDFVFEVVGFYRVVTVITAADLLPILSRSFQTAFRVTCYPISMQIPQTLTANDSQESYFGLNEIFYIFYVIRSIRSSTFKFG